MKKFIIALVVILAVALCGVGIYMYTSSNNDNTKLTDEQVNDIIDTYLNNRALWENTTLMPEDGVAGIYQTGSNPR